MGVPNSLLVDVICFLSSHYRPEKLLIFPTVEKISVPEEMAPASSDDEDEIDMSGVESQTVIASGSSRHHPRPLAVCCNRLDAVLVSVSQMFVSRTK